MQLFIFFALLCICALPAVSADAPKIEIKELKKQSTLVFKTKAKQSEIAKVLGAAFGTVMGTVAAKNVKPVSPAPFAKYTMGKDDTFEIEAGVVVPEGTAGAGDVVAGDLPAGKVAFAVHTGPYDKLHETHALINEELKKQGKEPADIRWEIYVNDPGDTKPEALKTEIMFC